MAERRMFSKKIIASARFLKMPNDTQALYMHLMLHADDDGIVEAFNIMRLGSFNDDSLQLLRGKGFIHILNEDLVTYIIDWTEHNKIRADRKIDSIYKDLLLEALPDTKILQPRQRADRKEKEQIIGTSQGQPTDNQLTTIGQPTDSIGKDRLGKDSIEINSPKDSFIELDWFEKVWAEYPRKEGKNRIVSKKSKLKSLYKDRENVEIAVKNYVAKIKNNKIDKQYTLMGSTFFNGDYLDYIQAQEIKPAANPNWRDKVKINTITNDWGNK